MESRASRLWCLLAVLGLLRCTTNASEVLVEIDSDAPLRRVLTIEVHVSPGTGSGTAHTWLRGSGVDGGIRLPASFAVVHANDAPASEQVLLTIVASLAPTGSEAAVTLHRTARFTFVPNQRVRLPIFLAMSCGAMATGCHTGTPAECTRSRLCEEQGLTCDDHGQCSALDVHTMPPPDASDLRSDGTDMAVREGCVPVCGARVCGPDGCGGSCGSCAPGDVCTAEGQCTCTPACSGRACGPDGCGASCGTCPSGQMCDATGRCVTAPCVPDCTGRVCGPDPRCGNSCGGCTTGQACNGSGQCVCSPACAGRACGPDGCGGSCGSCPGGQSCNASGQCVCNPDCSGRNCGPDGCGGTCGACPGGQSCNGSGQCVCNPDCSGRVCGPDDCGGSCGGCSGGQSCNGSGQCVCPSGQTSCGGSCVDLSTDTSNCGTCGHTCGSGALCSGGSCACDADHRLVGGVCLPSCGAALGAAGLQDNGYGCCPSMCTTTEVGPTFDCTHCCENTGPAACGCASPLIACGGSCVDTNFDPSNCGGCGITCTSGSSPACCYGACVDLDNDSYNCGGCGINCPGICSYGGCF